MSEYKLSLSARTLTGKKLKSLRDAGLIPSVIFGGEAPILASSDYNATSKAIHEAGYHSPIDLSLDGKTILGLVKNVAIDPVSRRIINIEFQAISADEVVEATTPIVLVDFEASEANKLHLTLLQVMEEIDVKAKPGDLPKELTVDASKLATLDDKITIADLVLPQGVELADKELEPEQVIASLYDAAAEAAAREAADAAAAASETAAADVPSDNGSKPAEAPAEESK